MTSKRLFWLLIGCVGLLFVGLIAGTYGANKLFTGQSATLAGLRASSQALDQEQIGLAKAKASVQKYANLQKIAQDIVPQDKDQAEAVRELVNIAGTDGITIGAITFPASTLGSLPTTAASSSSSATTTRPTVSASSGTLSQLTPVTNIPGVYLLQINVTSDQGHPVSYTKLISFLSGLEHNRRTAQVSAISITPDKDNASLLSFSLTIDEYIKP